MEYIDARNFPSARGRGVRALLPVAACDGAPAATPYGILSRQAAI
jgi:hypothetical protein